MKYLFITNSGETMPIAARLKQEGQTVGVYIHNPKYGRNYDNMISKFKLPQLKSAVAASDLVVFDMNKPVETANDRNFQKVFGVRAKNGQGTFGPVADRIRQSKPVLGASSWTEQLELDRNLGAIVAKKAGLRDPETMEFSSLTDGAKFLRGKRTKWVFKPHENQDLDLTYVEYLPGELLSKFENEYQKRIGNKIDYILQRRVDGVEISTEGWWNGKNWWGFNHTMEDKTLMNDDLGPRIGSANNTVWVKTRRGLGNDAFTNIAAQLKDSGYIGPLDINAIVDESDRKLRFLEFTPRLGYDAVYCLLSLLEGKVNDFFTYAVGLNPRRPKFKKGFAASTRISVPPYPYETVELLDRAKGIEVSGELANMWLEDVRYDGRLKCAGADGILGVVTGTGKTIKAASESLYDNVDEIKIAGYGQWRTDNGVRAAKDYSQLKKWGLTVD